MGAAAELCALMRLDPTPNQTGLILQLVITVGCYEP